MLKYDLNLDNQSWEIDLGEDLSMEWIFITF